MATALRRKCVCGHADWRHKSEIGDLTYCRSCDCDRWQDSAPAEAPNGQGGDATDEITTLRAELALAKATVDELQEQSLSWEKRSFELGEQQDGLVKALNELRADRDRLLAALTEGLKWVRHHEDAAEICYKWCPSCMMSDAIHAARTRGDG